jgi:hypothetical protein
MHIATSEASHDCIVHAHVCPRQLPRVSLASCQCFTGPDQGAAWHPTSTAALPPVAAWFMNNSMASTQEQQWHDAELRNFYQAYHKHGANWSKVSGGGVCSCQPAWVAAVPPPFHQTQQYGTQQRARCMPAVIFICRQQRL